MRFFRLGQTQESSYACDVGEHYVLNVGIYGQVNHGPLHRDKIDVDFDDLLGGSSQSTPVAAPALTFTVEQLEAMLVWAKARGASAR